MTHVLRLATGPAFLLLCLVLGGASAAGFGVNLLLQLLALALIVWALLARRSTGLPSPARQLIGILALMLIVGAIQLVPLPPGLWQALPGREQVAEGFRLLGQPLPWLPLSLAPYETISSLLWLLPAIAILLVVVKLGGYKPGWIAWTLAAVSAVSVAVGALQVVGGESSPWYFYEITNYGSPTGFFSNANHLATLLVVTIPFLAALYQTARRRGGSAQSASGIYMLLSGAVGIVAVGILINASLAGFGLAIPAIAASLLMLKTFRGRPPVWTAPLLAVVAIGSVALVFTEPFDNNLTTAQAEASPESRYNSFTRSLRAAKDFMPVGSGIGTFVEIYPMYEDPAAVTNVYVNHVHSDFIEIALETGIPGLAVLLLFLVWWARRVIASWSAEEPDYFARAATIASAVILAHSVVDYPLRTAAISALFAICCALMAEPRPRTRRAEKPRPDNKARHLSAD